MDISIVQFFQASIISLILDLIILVSTLFSKHCIFLP
jgi:hypothetical protein